ncbi:MAG: LysR family transcriptional regulator [Pseudobdellovibrionaceae bacterium]
MGRIRDLNSVRCFLAVAKSENFSFAAKNLQQPKSFVSRKVRELETDLKTMLFRRGTRKTTLIKSALPFYEACASAMSLIDESANSLDDIGLKKIKIKMGATTDIGSLVLAPIVERKLLNRDRFEIEYSLNDEAEDVFDFALDFSIRMLNIKDDRLVGKELGPIMVGLFVNVKRLKLKRVNTKSRLVLFRGSSFSAEDISSRHPKIRQLLEQSEVTYTNSISLIRDLVLNHGYEAFLPFAIIQEDLKAGRMVQVSKNIEFSIGKAYLVYSKERFGHPEKVQVRNFIESELRKVFQFKL